jgi:hypothetical protein
MSAKGNKPTKNGMKGIFSFIRAGNASSPSPSRGSAPIESTSAGDSCGVLGQKGDINGFGMALVLLSSVGDGEDLLAPLREVCNGLKVLVDTAEVCELHKIQLPPYLQLP